MNTIDFRELILKKNPIFLDKFPEIITRFLFKIISKLLHEKKINDFISSHKDKTGVDFIDEIFEHLDFSFTLSQKDREKIPAQGKLIIIANHPLGGLDGLVLIKLISDIRRDIKILVNDVLLQVDNLNEYFLPFDLYNVKSQKENVAKIIYSLKNEEALIIFPAGEVSRFSPKGIADGKWQKGVLYFANKFKVPILPIYIDGRNSFFFYFISFINKKFSTLLLPREFFNKTGKTVNLVVGNTIPYQNLSSSIKDENVQLKLIRKHLYKIGKNKKGIFKTERNIVKQVDRQLLKKQLFTAPLLGETDDGKKIFQLEFDKYPDVIREIARLREITFRKVGEGTGKKIDFDVYDKFYKHIVLWDELSLEIVGSYRLGICDEILLKYGEKGLYTSTLFNYSNDFRKLLPFSVELGRSFIQSKYWNSSALDYLWQGIGLFLYHNDSIKYLFGGVSLSSSYHIDAQEMIIFFYNKWFGDNGKIAEAKNPFQLSEKRRDELSTIFGGSDYKSELRILKDSLKMYGLTIPTLFKQYSELCDEKGCRFFDFGIDPDFQNCVDGFIFVEIAKIKPLKKERYIKKVLSEAV
jgi:putative hemolysin